MSTTRQFKDVLMTRTENMKAQQDRRSNFSSNTRAKEPRALFTEGSNNAPDTVIDMNQLQQGRSQQQQQLVVRDNYHAQRADAVESISSTIVSISEIFTQLATMVSEQGEMVERYVACSHHVLAPAALALPVPYLALSLSLSLSLF
eukprot:TRINITY_DN2898_c0_g1_i1.p1 TRINITY_DN2898_c0_g1~~TRINITY_DN2898_c0_g1_i1.p1  ORF type:complete len:146 (+),score=34.23 TRINITY_DN2898_c0_g1_i1:563-1000(+)